MKTKLNRMIERIEMFKAAWLENGPDASFAGMTYAEFEEATKAPEGLGDEVLALRQKMGHKRVETQAAIAEAAELLDLVANSVKGTQGFGSDSALYRAFGYVRKSERKTGLTRKGLQSPSTDAS